MKLLIISGRSGSGKCTVLSVLEDVGYNCIDNLPVSLLPAMVAQIKLHKDDDQRKFAIGVDVRTAWQDLDQLPCLIDDFRQSKTDCQMLFLDASDNIIIKRFSETRRRHPLSDDHTDLLGAIKQESTILSPVSQAADQVIDTSTLSLHELRDLIKKTVLSRGDKSMVVQFQSFGFKYGLPTDADLVFDVRCLPNPHWVPELRSMTGLDKGVATFLSAETEVRDMQADIEKYLERWLPSFIANNRSYITVAIGCTGGQHRSVYLAQNLYQIFTSRFNDVQIRHRQLDA
jgi:UPF0042 nucleotide-binding protein